MDRNASKLSGTGCDFVVATTEASINSSLLEYLAEDSQPVEYIYYLADEIGNATLGIGRDELLEKTGGIDPFDIDAETSYDDAQIMAVMDARFMVGIRMQLGFPPGVNPRDLSVVSLVGDRPTRVLFNMYCSQVTVIQNTPPPPSRRDKTGTWSVWNQPAGQPWVAQAEVDLVVADLDHNLANSNYLNNHPDVKDKLSKALIANDKRAPFPDHPSVSAIISACSWGELCSLFGQSSSSFACAPNASSSTELQQMVFAPGHALAGLTGVILGCVSIFKAESETGKNPFSKPGTVLAIVAGALQGATNFLAPRDPVANEFMARCTWGLLSLRVLCKIFFAARDPGEKVPRINVGKLVMSNARGVGALVDAVLILPDIVITGWHIGELAQKPAGKVKSAAILEECGNVAAWISRVAYALALNDPEPDSKEMAVGLTGVGIWIAAGFQFGEAEWC